MNPVVRIANRRREWTVSTSDIPQHLNIPDLTDSLAQKEQLAWSLVARRQFQIIGDSRSTSIVNININRFHTNI